MDAHGNRIDMGGRNDVVSYHVSQIPEASFQQRTCPTSAFPQICTDNTIEGGWAHTLSCCLKPVIKGMRINRHKELVCVLRNDILHSKKGNAKIYAYLVATRDDTINP